MRVCSWSSFHTDTVFLHIKVILKPKGQWNSSQHKLAFSGQTFSCFQLKITFSWTQVSDLLYFYDLSDCWKKKCSVKTFGISVEEERNNHGKIKSSLFSWYFQCSFFHLNRVKTQIYFQPKLFIQPSFHGWAQFLMDRGIFILSFGPYSTAQSSYSSFTWTLVLWVTQELQLTAA